MITEQPSVPNVVKPRVFLSYGRRDASHLADRLRIDLESRGYEVWKDSHRIRTGKDWESEIEDGLRSTQVVIVLLSPHAVRRSINSETVDGIDSVCLDEISFARFARPPKPIVPVMAITCEPPFCLFRLDYTDMTRWSQSEAEYKAGFERLLDGLGSALRGELPTYREWHRSLPSFDFSAYLHEKRRDFVGREWLFRAIDEWRTGSSRERALLILGDPGVGKTAMMAQLVYYNPGGQVLAYHCCRADDPDTLRPARLVRSFASMIASRVPSYAAQLEEKSLQDILGEDVCERNPIGSFERAILEPLERLPAPAEGVRCLVIDAVDEALTLIDPSVGIVGLLAACMERLPAWIKLVATTRRDPEVLERLSGLRATTLDSQRSENHADIDRFIANRLRSPELSGRLASSDLSEVRARKGLCESANGNFLYVRQALQDIERDLYSFDRMEELPKGLHGIYRRFFERYFPEGLRGNENARSLLEVLIAAQHPLSTVHLAEVSTLDHDAMEETLARLAPFVIRSEDRLSLYHRSLADWLTTTTGAFRISVRRGHKRFSELGLAVDLKNRSEALKYNDLFLPLHLAASGEWDRLGQIYSDPQVIKILSFSKLHETRERRLLLSNLIRALVSAPAEAWASVEMLPIRLFQNGWDFGPKIGNFDYGCLLFYSSISIACGVAEGDDSKKDWLANFLYLTRSTLVGPGYADWFSENVPGDPYASQIFFNGGILHAQAAKTLSEQGISLDRG